MRSNTDLGNDAASPDNTANTSSLSSPSSHRINNFAHQEVSNFLSRLPQHALHMNADGSTWGPPSSSSSSSNITQDPQSTAASSSSTSMQQQNNSQTRPNNSESEFDEFD